MRKNVLILVVFSAAIIGSISLVASAINEQTVRSDEKGKTLFVDADLGSTDTLYTDAVNTVGFSTVQPTARYLTSSSSKPKITIIRQDSYFSGVWSNGKTITTADSVETVQTYQDTLSAPWVRYVIIGASGNPADTDVKLHFRFNK